jgi:hypothetical protein
MTEVMSHSSVLSSGFGMAAAKYSQLELPAEVTDSQDMPLDLTMHHAGTRV